MPFYEYECSNCKFYSELMQKISDPPLKKCSSCGKNTMKKLVSAPNFRLKGGGWYETDFKSDQENKRNLAVEKEPEPESKPEAKPATETKAESKPVEAKPVSEPKPTASKSAAKASAKKSKAKPKAAVARRARR